MNSPSDRQRTDIVKGRKVTFTLLAPAVFQDIPFDKVTSVAVVPVTEDGKIVVADLVRGPDLPGGHVRSDETSCAETARREALEEAGVLLGALVPAAVIQSDFYGAAAEQLTYMITMTGRVTGLQDVVPDGETLGRKICTAEEFLGLYVAGDKGFMRQILDMAGAALSDAG